MTSLSRHVNVDDDVATNSQCGDPERCRARAMARGRLGSLSETRRVGMLAACLSRKDGEPGGRDCDRDPPPAITSHPLAHRGWRPRSETRSRSRLATASGKTASGEREPDMIDRKQKEGRRAADGEADRLDSVPAAVRHRLGHRCRRWSGTRRVRRPGLLRIVEQAQPEDRDECRLSAPHSRGRAPVGDRARHCDLLHHRGVAIADPRADPAPALLVQPALAALCAGRSGRRRGRARCHRRRSGAAQTLRRGDHGRRRGVPETARTPGTEIRRAALPRRCAPSRRARRRARSSRTPPRPASW